jgi:hypothetical protein
MAQALRAQRARPAAGLRAGELVADAAVDVAPAAVAVKPLAARADAAVGLRIQGEVAGAIQPQRLRFQATLVMQRVRLGFVAGLVRISVDVDT